MRKKITAILPFVIIVILGVIGIIGYTRDKAGKEPVRVLFRTKGGPVVFTHKYHNEMEEDCTVCHHNMADSDQEQWSCRSCHIGNPDYEGICDDRPIHKKCIGANCLNCHSSNGMDTSDCKLCHKSY